MPGPVRYTKSGKVKKSAPRKYESGKGWSNLTPKEQAAPAVPQASPPAPSKAGRRSSIRKAAGPIGPVGISPRRQRREAIVSEIRSQQDTRKTNQEALGFVGDALAKVAEVITAEPETDIEKGLAPLTALMPTVGIARYSGLKNLPKEFSNPVGYRKRLPRDKSPNYGRIGSDGKGATVRGTKELKKKVAERRAVGKSRVRHEWREMYPDFPWPNKKQGRMTSEKLEERRVRRTRARSNRRWNRQVNKGKAGYERNMMGSFKRWRADD